MAPEAFKCSNCQKELPRGQFHEFATNTRKRPVTSRCRDCRKEDYYRSKYETVCICCLKHRPLNSNAQCVECNAESGLRQCKQCGKILPLFLSFYGPNKKCKDCKKIVDS